MNGLDVKELRTELKLSQLQLANFLSVSVATVANWERGRAEIPKTKQPVLEQLRAMGRVSQGGTTINVTRGGNAMGHHNVTGVTAAGSDSGMSDRLLAELAAQRSQIDRLLEQNKMLMEQNRDLINKLINQ